MARIELGTKVHHIVTGIKGIAVSRTEYLSGCAHIGVQRPIDKDGKLPAVRYCDEPMCKVIGKTKIVPPKEPARRGGPQDSPPDRS